MFDLTIFKNAFDNKTHRRQQLKSWSSFVSLLKSLSEKGGSKGGTNSSPLISPAVYIENSTRSNRNVMCWGAWCALDVDDLRVDDTVKNTVDKYCGKYRYVCYSTASSTEERPKFRIVFPLTEKVLSHDIQHFWFALNKETGEIGDKQTKDLSRMYYVPAVYPNAYNFFFTNEGETVDPIKMMDSWQFQRTSNNSFLDKLPAAMREQLIEYRKQQAENTDVTWTSYRDCPFFPKKLAQEYMAINGTGWYHKMYQIMVAVAGNAVKANYPITPREIATLCKQLDAETGNWYENRPWELEANSAIEFIYRS